MKKKSMTAILLLCFLLSSCVAAQNGYNGLSQALGGIVQPGGTASTATTQNGSNNSTLWGTGLGAAGGAALGQLFGGDTKATIIGTAVGAIAGYFIAVQSTTKQVKTAAQTKSGISKANQNKPVLAVSEKSLLPSQRVKPGEKMTVTVTYIVYDNYTRKKPVREVKSIWHNGEQIKVLGDKEEMRDNGTYESLLSFKLPEQVEKGQYEIRHTIKTPSKVTNSIVPFTVI